MRTWFCTCARPEMIRPVCPPEMPKTYSIPASASTRATRTRDGVSSFSIRSTGMAILPDDCGELATAGEGRQRELDRFCASFEASLREAPQDEGRILMPRTNRPHPEVRPKGASKDAIPVMQH